MACTYTYKNQQYEYNEIIDLIKSGSIENTGDINKARKWLKDKLGMTDDQILNVKGLIDNKSFGRLQNDGKILLSTVLETGTEYHEAFHRVYRFFLTEDERNDLLSEFKSRKNWKKLIEPLRKRYSGLSDDALIEEYIAEEFRDYVLSEGTLKIPQAKRSNFFSRLVDWIRSLLGLNVSIQQVYDNINAGKYSGTIKPNSYFSEPADRLIINGNEVGIAEKNELIGAFNVLTVKSIINSGGIYPILDNTIDPDSQNKLYLKAFRGLIKELQNTNNIELAKDLIKDVLFQTENGEIFLNPKSKFVAEHVKHLSAIGINLKLPEIDASEETLIKDAAMMKVSFEFDPTANMSKAIKLMLSSIVETDSNGAIEPSKVLGIIKQLEWSDAANYLFYKLAGLPAKTDVFLEELKELSQHKPWVNQLISYLESGTGYNKLRLLNQFVQTFSKNKYDFLIGIATRDGEIFPTSSNFETAVSKVIEKWKNQLIDNNGDVNGILAQFNQIDINETNVERIADILGITGITPEILNSIVSTGTQNKPISKVLVDIANTIADSIEAGITIDRLFNNLRGKDEKYSVAGSIKAIAEKVAEKDEIVNLTLFNAENKKVYQISLNTYQTILVNGLNYIARKGEDYDSRLEMVKEEFPHLINAYNSYVNNDGELKILSYYLNSILNGNTINLHIFDGVKIPGQQGKSFDDLVETDLLSFKSNSILKGVSIAAKHSDRSTIYAYSISSKDPLISETTTDAIKSKATAILAAHMVSEINRIKEFNDGLGSNVTFYNEKADKLSLFSWLDVEVNVNEIMESDNPYSKILSKYRIPIQNYIDKQTNEVKDKLKEWKVIDGDENIGISRDIWDSFGSDIDAMSMSIAMNTIANHIEEFKLFAGDPAFYKTSADLYKRLSMQSSTGEVIIVDELNNEWVRQKNQSDVISLYDSNNDDYIESYHYNKPTDGSMSEYNLQEEESYASSLASNKNVKSDIDGEMITEMQSIFENGLIQSSLPQMIADGIDESKAKSSIKNMAAKYASYYENINENDGGSWLNIFAWREMMHRSGKWSDQLENTFQVELAILQLKNPESLKDLIVYFSDDGSKISANERPGYTDARKIFEMKSYKNLSPSRLFSEILQSGTTLKPQYTGPMYFQPLSKIDNDLSKLNVIAGRKTSYFVLFPSVIMGTKLQQLNSFMLENFIDVVHLKSAAKYGTIDEKKVANNSDVRKRGSQFYSTDGKFNYENLSEDVNSLTSYLDMRYMKHQLEISNKPKNRIKNSTQSAKIILSGLTVNGVPRDVKMSEDEWSNLSDVAKVETSPIYKRIKTYKDNLASLVNRNIKRLKQEVNYSNDGSIELSALVDVLEDAARDRNEPDNILDAIELFASSGILETLPNKNKIENILFSIVSNRVINLKRPGDAKPQIMLTGWEPIDSNREVVDGKYTTRYSKDGKFEEIVSFYKQNPDGSLKPAEIIVPFPKKYISRLLDIAETTNVVEAIDWINEQIANGSATMIMKGLRIPNQQLSSNDVFTVKKFTMPLLEAFAIVPSEIVAKVGSDFDIDKLQLYTPNKNYDFTDYTAEDLSEEQKYIEYVKENIPVFNKELKQATASTQLYVRELNDDLLQELNEINKKGGEVFNHFLESIQADDNFGKPISKRIKIMNSSLKKNGVKKLEDRLQIIISSVNEWKDSVTAELDGEDMVMLYENLHEELNNFYNRWMEEIIGLKGEAIVNHKIEMQLAHEMVRFNSAKDVAESEDLLSYDEWSKLPDVDRMPIKHVQNDMLKVENEILLSKDNAHIFLAPLVDDRLKIDIKNKIFGITGKTLDKTNPDQVVTLWKNVLKHIHFLGGKAGVGQVATEITGHSTSMADNQRILRMFSSVVDGEIVGFETKLPFKGMEDSYTLARMLDLEGNNIIETLSILLTSQVDIGKNPYPVEIGINNQTLNIITYLTRRGVPLEDILLLVSQNSVQQYLKEQRINESIVHSAKDESLSKNQLIDLVLTENKLSEAKFKQEFSNARRGNISLTRNDLRNGIKNKDNQERYLALFLKLVEETKVFSYYKQDLTPDTKTLKNMDEYDAKVENFQLALEEGFVPVTYRSGLLAPFFGGRELYNTLYSGLYKIRSLPAYGTIDVMKSYTAMYQRGADNKTKARNVLENDLILYLIQNFHPLFEKHSFDSLFKGQNSVAREIQSIVTSNDHPLKDNYALNNMLPLLLNAEDTTGGGRVDNIKLFDKLNNTVSLNDMHDAMLDLSESNPELYERMVVANLYQAGLNNSPFNYDRILPADLRHRILVETFDKSIDQFDQNMAFDFFTKFQLNNINYLPKWIDPKDRENPFYFRKKWSKKQKQMIIVSKDGKSVFDPIGGTFYKRYNLGKVTSNNNAPIENDGLNVPPLEAQTNPVESQSNQELTPVNVWAGKQGRSNPELSNLADRPFKASYEQFDAGQFRTVEGAFQAIKAVFANEEVIYNFENLESKKNKKIVEKLRTANGFEAKKLGRQIENLPVERWDKMKYDVMFGLVLQSFEQNPKALEKLLATGNRPITHTQDKGFWGENFPAILEEVRTRLANLKEISSTSVESGNEFDSLSDSPYANVQFENNRNDNLEESLNDTNTNSREELEQQVRDNWESMFPQHSHWTTKERNAFIKSMSNGDLKIKCQS